MEDGSGASSPGSAVLRGNPSAAYRDLLRNRSFRNLGLATLTSALGDWIGFLAIIALTADILGPTRGAAFAVSGVMAARVLPSLLLGPVAGVFVDRWDRKRVLIGCDLGRGLVMALIPFTDEVLTLVLATLVIEVMSAMFAPAKDAVFPTLVRREQLVEANQINLVVTYGTLPLGGVLYAGLLALATTLAPEGSFLAQRPVALAIWFNALSFWVSAPLLANLRIPEDRMPRRVDPSETPGAWEQLKEGFRFVGGHPVIRALILGVMVAAAVAGVVITTGEFFARLLNAGPSGYGILVAAVGMGLLGGLVASTPLSDRFGPERLFAPAVGVAGVALIVTAVMPTLWWAMPSSAVMGAGAGIVFIVGYTVLQTRADDTIRGRTFGAFNSGVRVAIFGASIGVPAMIGVMGRERRVLTTLEDGTEDLLYPYVFGGVRITLITAGVLAIVGSVLVGRALHKAVDEVETAGDLELLHDGAAVAATLVGRFVVFEGGDGAGKSTQIRLLRSAIERTGREVLITREPGGTELGEQIRELLLSSDAAEVGDRAEALLYAAARAQHVDDVIVPALERGVVVLCDRFVDSSVVYQGAARRLGVAEVAELNRWATGELVPDLVVLLDLDPVEGLERVAGDGTPDRLEAAGLDFHRDVRRAYRQLADDDPDRYLVLDATRPVEDLHADVRRAVLGLFDLPAAAPVEEPRRLTGRDAEVVDDDAEVAADGAAAVAGPGAAAAEPGGEVSLTDADPDADADGERSQDPTAVERR
jgi:dTMP kinase